jgi:uncharacterized protein YidB (DUF937 family)
MGRVSPRRAGWTALALLAVTTALAVLLAVLSHLAWPPVLVSIIGTLPTLYLAWLAVPGAVSAAKRTVHGRPVRLWDPVDLGVHQVIGGGPVPAYVRRPHDELLRAVLDPAVPASRLVVVRGGSSTGKTRAAWEAVAARLADWRLDYPRDPAALHERLEGEIPARTVLWLGELRQYADTDDGAKVLGRLADLLQGKHHLLITTVWPEHWDTYIRAARPGPGPSDPADIAGRLLEALPELTGRPPAGIDPARGGVIDVPSEFTAADLEAAASANDPVLAETAAAAAAAGKAGQLTQYLAGVPDLLRRYDGPGDPYGQAIIKAAMDATRLGHANLLPAALLQEAAVGYLDNSQRTKDIAAWRDGALAWATAELHGAVRAVQPIPPPYGTGVAGYQVADYLDQYGRRTRQDQLGPSSLWDALIAHTASGSDLTRLGRAARERGLYRHAATLWTTAAALGSAAAALQLIDYLRWASPGDPTRVARWTVGHASLDNTLDVARLVRTLSQAGSEDAVQALLARNPAGHASLDSSLGVVWLLQALRQAGDGDAARALADRAGSHASLDNTLDVVRLLGELRQAGDGDAALALADRAGSHASLDNTQAVAWLLGELREAGAEDAVQTLLARDPAGHANLSDPRAVASLLQALRWAGAEDAVQKLLARDPAGHANLSDPAAVAWLLRTLREAGYGDAVQALLVRNPAGRANLSDPAAVAWLLRTLHEAGAEDAVQTLLARDPAGHANLSEPQAVAWLLRALRWAGAEDAVQTLLARDPAGHANLSDPAAVAWLLYELRQTGAEDEVQALLARNPAGHANLSDPAAVAWLLRTLREAGAEDAVQTLLARDPAGHVSIGDPRAVEDLLRALRRAGAEDEDAVRALADRAARHNTLDNPEAVIMLLQMLRQAGEQDAARALAERAARHTTLDDPRSIARLLQTLRQDGDRDAARALAHRAANAGMFHLFLEVDPDEASKYRFGREPDGTPSQSWEWQEPDRSGL